MDRYLIKKLNINEQNDGIRNCEESTDKPVQNPAVETPVTAVCNLENMETNSTDISNDEDETVGAQEQVKYKKKYKRKFREEHTKKFGKWLGTNEKKETLCLACNTIISGGITHIERHSKTLKHRNKLRASETTLKIDQMVDNPKKQSFNNQVKTTEMLLVLFIAEHNLPFLILDHLGKFLAHACPDSEIAKKVKINRVKGTHICKQMFAKESLSQMRNDLNNSFFSIIIDETNDVSVSKCLVIVVRYFSHKEIKERFLSLIQVKDSTAEGIFTSIMTFLTENNINVKNLLGLAADNCSVMMGNMNSVQTRFKTVVPHIYVLGCVCHSFNLCSSAACAKLPKSVEQLARDIYNYFSNSAVRLIHLKECQVFLNLKPHKILRLSQTRWLSLQAVVNRILDQYDALILFFTNETFEKDHLNQCGQILTALKNPVFKLYFIFLSYVLDLINQLNLEFQSATLKLHVLLSRVSTLYKVLLKNFVKKEYFNNTELGNINVNDPHVYLKIEEIYFGPRVEMYILQNKDSLDNTQIHDFRVYCLSFYVELTSQIKKRFSFDDPVLKELKLLDPKEIFSDFKSVVPLVNRFPVLCDDIDKLDSEWRILIETEELLSKKDLPVTEFWNLVFRVNNNLNNLMFPHVKKFVTGLMCLPHSSAAAERIFSQLNLIKTKVRNRLLTETCDSLLHAKELLDDSFCYTFKPTLSLLRKDSNTDLSF